MMSPDQSYLQNLNSVQRKAVQHIDGPVMVIAGPGSGKTRVLTYRIAYLLQNQIPPYQILALTFTNKAAREMKERIGKLVGEASDRVWAGTFHSIFARILRVEAEKIGYPSAFTIYDRDDSRSLLSDIIRDLKLDKKKYNIGALISRISSAKSNLITPERYLQDEELLEYDKASQRPLTHLVYKRYTERCYAAGAMDFDDLLLQMFRLLYTNVENVREKYQQKFRHVLVDEFQDTNHLQYQIIKLLVRYPGSAENVCVVGDDAQSIYSFRGATIENILQFEQDFAQTATYKLEQNYRSTKPIVSAANQVITFNKKQIQKEIWTEEEGEHKIRLLKAISDSDEGRLVSNAIVEYKNRYHLANRDIAILYRTNAQSRVFEESLRRNNLHYRVFGGLSFYQRKEVKDLLAYMRLAVNPKDDEAFKRIVNYPRRGIGKTTINKITDRANSEGKSIWEVVNEGNVPSRAAQSLEEFLRLMRQVQSRASGSSAYDAAIFIAKKSGIYDLLKEDNTIEGRARMENVNALLDGIKAFIEDDELSPQTENAPDKSLASYIQNIALLTDLDEETSGQDYISLMSAHAAKGLEFKAVFVVGLEENLFPSFLSQGSPDQLDEERRLFYVAITRAEQYLTLSYAKSRYQYGQIRYNDPSRFLEEINEDLFESSSSIRERPSFPKPKILGGLRKKTVRRKPVTDPANFVPSPVDAIQQGAEVLHLTFGKGTVKAVEGSKGRQIATIHFSEIDDQPEKKIVLRFAKLQVLA